MKKILLVSLLAATAGSANAQSNVTMFGTVGGGLRWVEGGKGGSQVGFDNNIVTGNSFGFTGKEDLGNGLNAIFMLQSGFVTGTGKLVKSDGTLFSQNAYVGISGNFGRITFGRQLTAATDIGVALDPDAAQGGSFYMVPGVLWAGNYFTLDGRFNNTIKYVGKFGGFTIRGSYSPGGTAGDSHAGSNIAAGTSYQYQTLIVSAAYQKTYNSTASQWAETAIAGAVWQIGAARVYASYSALSVEAPTTAKPERRDKIPAIGLRYQISPFLQLSGATYYDIANNLSNASGANGRKLTSYAMMEYFLSKRTELYLEYDRNGFSGAYKKDPTNVSALNLRPDGRAVTGVSIGMITQF